MRITILTVGTQGDVQPNVALAQGLEAAGHSVSLAAHTVYERFVRAHDVAFRPLAGDPRTLLGSKTGREILHSPRHTLLWARRVARLIAPYFEQVTSDALDASRGADLIVAGPNAVMIGFHVAEKLQVPLARSFFAPTPTFLTASGELRAARVYGGPATALANEVARQTQWQLFRPLTNRVRRSVLNLAPLGVREPFRLLDKLRQPLLYHFSPTVLPRDPHWGAWVHVTGYWFLDGAADWTPPPDLARFLDSGPPPVYVGFGSMPEADARKTTNVVCEALARAGQRGVLQTGWAGLGDRELPAHVIAIGDAPHSWLFPRMAAVVHHGGAGTTGYGLRDGVPSVIVPFSVDQPLWGRRVHALGAGPAPLPRRRLSAPRLAQAIERAVSDPAIRRAAKRVGERIRCEDGVGNAVAVFEGQAPARLELACA